MINLASLTTEELSMYQGKHREVAQATSRWPVSVRGCGLVSPSARSSQELLDILRGRRTKPTGDAKRVLSLDDLHAGSQLRPRESKRVDRFSLLAIAAARAAMQDAGLTPDDVARCGIVSGNMMCGWTFTEPQVRALHAAGSAAVSPYLATAWFPAAPQGQVTIHLKMQGFAKTVTTDRCAGAQAIGLAFDRIRFGRSDLLLAGGVEAPVTPFVEAAFSQLQQEPKELVEAAAYLLLAPGVDGGSLIGAHETFPISPLDCFVDGSLAGRVSAFVRELPAHLPVTTVVCNVAAIDSIEEGIAHVINSVFRNEAIEMLFPTRAIGECLAASGAASAVLADLLLKQQTPPCSALVCSLGHQCADLLWMYREF